MNELFKMQFKQRLADCRVESELTQKELGEISGFTAANISHFETGRRVPSAFNLSRLCVALDVTSDYLLGFSDIKFSLEVLKDIYER